MTDEANAGQQDFHGNALGVQQLLWVDDELDSYRVVWQVARDAKVEIRAAYTVDEGLGFLRQWRESNQQRVGLIVEAILPYGPWRRAAHDELRGALTGWDEEELDLLLNRYTGLALLIYAAFLRNDRCVLSILDRGAVTVRSNALHTELASTRWLGKSSIGHEHTRNEIRTFLRGIGS